MEQNPPPRYIEKNDKHEKHGESSLCTAGGPATMDLDRSLKKMAWTMRTINGFVENFIRSQMVALSRKTSTQPEEAETRKNELAVYQQRLERFRPQYVDALDWNALENTETARKSLVDLGSLREWNLVFVAYLQGYNTQSDTWVWEYYYIYFEQVFAEWSSAAALLDQIMARFPRGDDAHMALLDALQRRVQSMEHVVLAFCRIDKQADHYTDFQCSNSWFRNAAAEIEARNREGRSPPTKPAPGPARAPAGFSSSILRVFARSAKD